MAKVLITGASGFIAGHCIIEMLNHGYDVRGTLRDAARGEALQIAASIRIALLAAGLNIGQLDE